MKRSDELMQKRAEVWEKAKVIHERAKSEGRETLNEAEQREWDGHMKEMDAFKTQAESAHAAEERAAKVAELDAEMSKPNQARAKLTPETDTRDAGGPLGKKEYRDAFMNAIRRGRAEISPEERRALSEGVAADGGLLLPAATNLEFASILRNVNVMRQLGTVLTVSTDAKIPMQATKATAYRTAEGKAATPSGVTFKGIELSAYKYTAEALASDELLQDADIPVDSFLNNELGLAIGELEEEDFITGDGVNKPRGILTQATAFSTAFASASVITATELMGVFHQLPRYYRTRPGCGWLMADSTVLAIRQLKESTTNQFIWQPGLQAGQPDTLLSKPVHVSDNIPAIAGSAKVMLFGDFSEYFIVDRKGITFKRLVEVYAENGQVAFLASKRTDGDLRRTDAVIAAQMHA